MPLIAIYNPVCGDGTALAFFEEHVLPMLSKYGKTVDKFVPTMYKGHAGELVLDFVKEQVAGEDITIILGSGDGTLHEIINYLSSAVVDGPMPFPRLHFAIAPCGTANALFSSLFISQTDSGPPISAAYRLQSIYSYLHSSRVVPLTLAIARLSPHSNARERPQVAISAVVMSTSLHASILNDSESLRKEMPGIERSEKPFSAALNQYHTFAGSK
jgi:diacylglycerol kinase family enzyme